MFIHCPPVNIRELSTENFNNKRYYVTPEGKFPSITSVLGSFPNPELLEWRKRVGELEANRVSKLASSRGTKMHDLCERYLKNEQITNKTTSYDAYCSFIGIQPYLNNINNIHYLECPLYSKQLKVAGRCDGIAEYNKVLSVIDFKSSKREKQEEHIFDYFLQATFYGLSYYELTNIMIKQIVIIIAVDDGQSQVFIKPIKNYIKPLCNKIKFYICSIRE